jgi:hypothetical protein
MPKKVRKELKIRKILTIKAKNKDRRQLIKSNFQMIVKMLGEIIIKNKMLTKVVGKVGEIMQTTPKEITKETKKVKI